MQTEKRQVFHSASYYYVPHYKFASFKPTVEQTHKTQAYQRRAAAYNTPAMAETVLAQSAAYYQ